MSLRYINRIKEGKDNFFDRFGFGKKKHFAKLHKKIHSEPTLGPKKILAPPPFLPKRHVEMPKKVSPIIRNKYLLLIAAIVVITVCIVAAEMLLWSAKTPLQAVSPTNITLTNQTPPVVEPPKPDLELHRLSLSSDKIGVGDMLQITASVKNSGEVRIDNISVTLLRGNQEIKKEKVTLAPGQIVDVSLNWIPANTEAGTQTITAIVDPGDTLDESIETNNDKRAIVEIQSRDVENVTDKFKRRTIDLTQSWYSERVMMPPKGGENYTYFDLTKDATGAYYLDVVIAGFKTVNQNNIMQVEVPDSSKAGWNRRGCLKETASSETCIWSGPEFWFELKFDNKKLYAKDQSGAKKSIATADKKITSINMVGIKFADWPGELSTFRITGAPQIDALVPHEFYEIVGDRIYVHPMRWNPRTLQAKVITAIRFKITTSA